MSFVGRAIAATTIPFTPATYDDALLRGRGPSAVNVTPDGAEAIPAVYACTTVITETTAMLPLPIYERLGEDGKRVARNHPLYDLLQVQPNEYQTAIEFREMMTAFAVNRGMGVAEIIAGPRGPVDQLKPLHPDLVWRDPSVDGRLRYKYADPYRHEVRTLLPSEVFVVNGRRGRGVIAYARESFELQLQMQRFATQMYRRGPRHSGALTHPKTLSDPARRALRAALDKYAAGGENEGRPLLLEEGMTWESVSLSMRDAEFVATMNHGVADVCRWYRVPQHKIQELLRSTNNNIERQSIDYATDTIMPWTIRWDQAILRDLIVAKQRFFAEHKLDGLLKADIKARYEAYAIAVSLGWMTRNEVRALENMNALPGLDEPMTPLNMDVGGTSVAFAPPQPMAVAYLRTLVRDAAARVVRKESATLAKLAERTGGDGEEWRSGVQVFYREHAEFVARVLRVDDETAERYAEARCSRVVELGPIALEGFDTDVIADLTETAVEKSAVLQLPAGYGQAA